MKYFKLLLIIGLLTSSPALHAQSGTTIPRGKLFIIGGGDRPPSLMKALVAASALKQEDYVVVLPMSSASPDTGSIIILKLTWRRFAQMPLLISISPAKK